MRNLVALQGEQAQASSFPIDTPVYICEAITAGDHTSPAIIQSSGTVVEVLLQMGRPGNVELFYNVMIVASNSWNRDGVEQSKQKELVRESRLRFRNGCPVYVQVDDSDECIGEGESRELEGIVLGFYDIPKDDERRPYCNHSFWYVVQICCEEKDEGGSFEKNQICYNVSPSEVRHRRPQQKHPTKCEIKNLVEEKPCQTFKIEMTNDDDDDGPGDEDTKEESVVHTALETVPDESVGGTTLIVPEENTNTSSRVNDNVSSQDPMNEDTQQMIGQSIEYCTTDDLISHRKDGPAKDDCIKVSIKREELYVPIGDEVQATKDQDVHYTNTIASASHMSFFGGKDEIRGDMNHGNISGSKRSLNVHDDEHPKDSLIITTELPSKRRRGNVKEGEDDNNKTDNGAEVEVSASFMATNISSSSLEDSKGKNRKESHQQPGEQQKDEEEEEEKEERVADTIQQDAREVAQKEEEKERGGITDTSQQEGVFLESNARKMLQPKDPQNVSDISSRVTSSTKSVPGKLTGSDRKNTSTSGGGRRSDRWIKCNTSEILCSSRKPLKRYPYVAIICVPTSPNDINGALLGRRGKKREEFMKTTKCWYAIAHNSDMQRIEIHGATKTVVETGTEVIRDKIFKWLGASARGKVDVKRIIRNTTARYYILPDKCNEDVALSTNTSQLHTQRAMKHSRDTKQDLEGTLQILLPPIERSMIHRVLIGNRGEKHKQLLQETKATSIRVKYSEKGASVVVCSNSIISARRACVFILSDIRREIGQLSGAKICYPS